MNSNDCSEPCVRTAILSSRRREERGLSEIAFSFLENNNAHMLKFWGGYADILDKLYLYADL